MARTKRKALSQKIRFEVFKRDSFTCAYCGRKAPDVVLQVDHIVPVAQGGTNDILNLVTSCVECNQGKSDRKLSDQSVVEKQRREMELRQERLEQIRMLGEWNSSLVDIREAELEQVDNLYFVLTNKQYRIKSTYLHGAVAKAIDQFGLATVLEALREGTAGYKGDATRALGHIGGICANISNPELGLKSRILARVKWRFPSRNWKTVAIALDRGRKKYGIFFLEQIMKALDELLNDINDTKEDWIDFCSFINGCAGTNKE